MISHLPPLGAGSAGWATPNDCSTSSQTSTASAALTWCGTAFALCFHCLRGCKRHFLRLAFPLPSWLRHCLCLAFPLPSCLRRCLRLVFPLPLWLRHAKTLPLPCASTAFVAKTLPLPCVPTAFVAKTVPFLAASQEECLSAPCRNGGACADSSTNSSVAVDELFCACSDGYSGDSCELDTDECASVRVGCL